MLQGRGKYSVVAATLSPEGRKPLTLAFSADGKSLLAAAADNTILRWNISAAAAPTVTPLEQTLSEPGGATFSRDAKQVARWPWSGRVSLYDAASSKSLHDFPDNVFGTARQAVFAPDGTQMAMVRREQLAVEWYDTTNWQKTRRLPLAQDLNSMWILADGKTLLAARLDGAVVEWQPGNDGPPRVLVPPAYGFEDKVYHVAASNDASSFCWGWLERSIFGTRSNRLSWQRMTVGSGRRPIMLRRSVRTAGGWYLPTAG
jgi:hypothetical protein